MGKQLRPHYTQPSPLPDPGRVCSFLGGGSQDVQGLLWGGACVSTQTLLVSKR